jgi:trigger factor
LISSSFPAPALKPDPFIMNIVVEKQPKCIATLRVEIPAEKAQQLRDKIVASYASKARVPGFRPGKAPRTVVEKRFGKEITEEQLATLVNEAFDETLKRESLRVLDFGDPRNLNTADDGGVTFESTLTLAPEITLPEYKGIQVTVPPLDVPDEDLQAQLQSLRERFAEFKDIEGRPAAMGDFAVMDYSSTVDGTPTDEFLGKAADYLSGREGFWIRMDEKSFLPGFVEKAVGMNPGETREITLTMPVDFPISELREKEMVFTTTLKELKEAILPELDDELAARLLPGKTLDELTDLIRSNMQHERTRRISDMKVNQIIGQLLEKVDFELPESMVLQETQNQVDSMVQRGVEAGLSEDEIASQQGDIFASAGQQAQGTLRSNFILQEIAKLENIAATDAELVNHLAQIAASRKLDPKKFIKQMQREGRLGSIRNSIVIGKAIDFLLEHAEVAESAEAAVTE